MFAEVYDDCIRIEFQGRGTLHTHVCAWAEFHEQQLDPIRGINNIVGRTQPGRERSSSPLVCHLDQLFVPRRSR